MNSEIPIERRVRDILADVLSKPTGNLGGETPLATLGWDSLASLEALAQLETELSITLDLRSFHEAHTIAALVDLTAKAVANQP
jgi:acyl carrier protein